jgi:hypothetical protein
LNQSCGFNSEIWERLGEIIMEVGSNACKLCKHNF